MTKEEGDRKGENKRRVVARKTDRILLLKRNCSCGQNRDRCRRPNT
jgi:hypothetical protein